MKGNKERILVLAPHTDDGELGCGATIVKYIEEGREVFYIAFSICQESVPEGYPANILEIEVKKATKVLGIKPENLIIENFTVRKFPEQRQDILERIVYYNKQIKPDLVFMPSSYDIHQDHNTIFHEGRRVFKKVSILGYEFIWNNFAFDSTAFSVVEEKQILKKMKALQEYSSQEHRFYGNIVLIKGQAQFRGVQIGKDYAEAFEVIRWIIE